MRGHSKHWHHVSGIFFCFFTFCFLNYKNLCLRLLGHAGMVIFGQVWEILIRCKVSNNCFFNFLAFYDKKYGKFVKNGEKKWHFLPISWKNIEKLKNKNTGTLTLKGITISLNLGENHLSIPTCSFLYYTQEHGNYKYYIFFINKILLKSCNFCPKGS